MVDLMIDMSEEPSDEGDKEFLYTNHRCTIQREEHQTPYIRGNYDFRYFGLPNDYHEMMKCSLQEELKSFYIANS